MKCVVVVAVCALESTLVFPLDYRLDCSFPAQLLTLVHF